MDYEIFSDGSFLNGLDKNQDFIDIEKGSFYTRRRLQTCLRKSLFMRVGAFRIRWEAVIRNEIFED